MNYIGNGPYCYANSASMFLSWLGEDIPPSIIEVIAGVGLSATVANKEQILWLNNQVLEPDLGIKSALEVLGFECTEDAFEHKDEDPFAKLKELLYKQPVILGPLDMGYLVYNPRHQYMHGADHWIIAYKIEGDTIFVHDPAGFPHVFINKEDLKKSWKAEKIFYRQGYYRYITGVKRIASPTPDEIYEKALERMRTIYLKGEERTSSKAFYMGEKAIQTTVQRIREGKSSQDEHDMLIYFTLPLGARRALDFAKFFDQKDPELAKLKRQQAGLLGTAHTLAVTKRYDELADVLDRLAETEKGFRDTLNI